MAYLTPAEVRQSHRDLLDDSRFPDAELSALVEEFEHLAERYRGVAYEPRSSVEVHPTAGDCTLILRHVKVRGEPTFEVDGSPVVVPHLSIDHDAGIVSGSFRHHSVAITYEHGFDAPPPAAVRACGLYVWREAMSAANPNTSNSYMTSNADLGIVERASTADWSAGRPTGWLDVDRALNGLDDYRTGGYA